MKLKSFVGKFIGKKPPPEEVEKEGTEGNGANEENGEIKITQQEISFANTMIEEVPKFKAVADIDIYVNNDRTNIYEIATDTRIGRDPAQTDIAIPELIVSKFHCSLHIIDGVVFVKDHNSTNGTFVNGQKIANRKLEDNDTITLGKKGTVRIIFHKK
jgi:pSer/pThr/pTyr-binding forkhead associated (FHA) protein